MINEKPAAGASSSPGPNPLEGPPEGSSRGLKITICVVIVLLLLGGGWAFAKRRNAKDQPAGGAAAKGGAGMSQPPVPIIPGVAEKKDVPIYLDGLGTVQAFNTVTVRSRVDGQVQKIAFTEGQDVKAGDLLAQIDPAPFKAQLAQSVAKKAQDVAQLNVARVTLDRDKQLLSDKILSQQDYDTQKALVEQMVATVQADQAAVDNAQTQLAYTSITASMDARAGLRLVDEGNIVHANDSNGIVVLTQLHPIAVVFTLPEQSLAQIQSRQSTSNELTVLAMDRDNRTTLGEGKLSVVDNQIDTTTGTIRLKAIFPNEDLKLWPGQFVNARLLVEVRKGGTVVPASVVQRGPNGAFAFVIASDGTNLTAQVRPLKVAQIEQGQALIDEGLSPGDRVVVDGQYKLQAKSKVKLPEAKANGKTNAAPAKVAGPVEAK